MRGSKFPADMHNYIWCPIYIPSNMIIGSVVSEELRWQDFGTDGRTDGRSDCTPRPAFAFGDAGKNVISIRHFWVKLYLKRKQNQYYNLNKICVFHIYTDDNIIGHIPKRFNPSLSQFKWWEFHVYRLNIESLDPVWQK